MRPSAKRLAALLVSMTVAVFIVLPLSDAQPVRALTSSISSSPGYYHHLAAVNHDSTTASHFYIVRSGDTLSGIAYRYLSGNWEGLYQVNRNVIGANPDLIYPHQALRIATEAGYKPPVARAQAYRRSYQPPRYRSRTSSHVTVHYGIYSFAGLEALWVSAGGPASVEWSAATIAECESGGNPRAYNPSGASGIWQILGAPRNWHLSTDWFNPWINALAAVAKFKQAGWNFSPWVCRA